MNPTVASDTIVQEITIKGTPERIFAALTNPEERMKWWGQEGRFRVSQFESDLRPGGKWVMRGDASGKPFTLSGEYREIERPRLLVFTWLPDWYEGATESLVRWDGGARRSDDGPPYALRADQRKRPQQSPWLAADPRVVAGLREISPRQLKLERACARLMRTDRVV